MPYRQSFATNPYLASIFEGIDLLVSDAERHNQIAQRQEESNAEFERQKGQQSIQRKVGLLSGIMESKDTFDPSTKLEAGKSLFKMVQDPETDISGIDLKGYQKPEEEGRALTEYATHEQFGFPKFKGMKLPHDVADFMEQESRMRRKDYFDRTNKEKTGTGTGKVQETPRQKTLDEYREEALKILHQGFTEEGFAGKAGLTPETVSQFLGVIDDLRRKDSEGKWTAAEDAIFNTLQPLEVSGVGSQAEIEALRGVILDAANKLKSMRK